MSDSFRCRGRDSASAEAAAHGPVDVREWLCWNYLRTAAVPTGQRQLEGALLFSHIFTSVTDFDRALAFYIPLMQSLGVELRFCERTKPWAGWHSGGGARPLFVICKPYDGQPHRPGNGQMVAFMAASRDGVRTAYRTALAHGGASEGEPGLRPHYHADYYGAYFRDPDGNKLCVACHGPETDPA